MDFKRKVIIGVSVILLLVALYLIISDFGKKSPDDGSVPCCELINNRTPSWLQKEPEL